jgi:DNA repair exonuclease SbcCD ATPase subunit
MPNLLLDLVVDRVDLVDEGANSAAFIKLYKRKERIKDMSFEEIIKQLKPEHAEVIKAELEKAKSEVPEEVSKKLTKLQDIEEELNEVKQELAKAKKQDTGEENIEDIIKKLDDPIQRVFKSMQAKADAAEALAKQLTEEREREEAIAKARELKALPVEEETLVEVVKDVSPEVFDILKKASDALESSDIFEEVGKGKGGHDTVDAWSKIEKKAEEIASRDNISKEKAIGIVVNENPDLYKEYLNGGVR